MRSCRFRRSVVIAGLALSLMAPIVPTAAVAAPQAASAYSASGKDGDGQPTQRPHVRSGVSPRITSAQSTPTPECPPVLMAKCSFDPAAYHNNDPADPTNYGNYDLANRPADGTKIKGVTVHDIEGTCEEANDAFNNPTFFASATYVICADGRVIQKMLIKDIAWTAGNWWYNSHFIQIEHAGHASNPRSYTNAMYTSSVLLVRYHSQKYGFPLDKAHVQGHDNVPATRTASIPGMHVDPGPFWNWERYLLSLGAPVFPSGDLFNPSMITIAPHWATNKQVVTGCNVSNDVPPPCVPQGGPFNTNFVYLYTQPSLSAPLITDPVTGAGSTEIENRSARAFYGSTFKVADRRINGQGIWYKIWFGGQAAWVYSPHIARTVLPTAGKCVTPKGSTPVSVYGRPLPEKAEWDAKLAQLNFTPPAGSTAYPSPLAYTIQPGQCYAVIEANVMPDHYFSWSHDNTYPRFRVTGNTPYVWVNFNGRHAFVKQQDVSFGA